MESRSHLAMSRQYRLRLDAGCEHSGGLSPMISLLARADSLSTLWARLLTVSLELLDHDCGHLQLWDEEAGALQLVCQQGFRGPPEALAALCDAPFNSLAIRGERVLIGDGTRTDWCARVRDVLIACGCVGVHAMPLVNPQGRTCGILTTYSDSEREIDAAQFGKLDDLVLQAVCFAEHLRERAALVAGARRKDEFLATLAHELRNSLAPMRSSIEILKLEETDAPLRLQARAILDRRLETLTRLIEDLMNASRIARGKLELCRERIALARVLEMAVETVAPRVQELRHDFALQLHDRAPVLDADPVRLTQVFVNLLDNAVKYTPPGGRICVSSRAERGGIYVEVTDSGIGLSPECIPHLYELFSQASPGREHRRGGLGIGLALAKRIVEMHAGSIGASSEGPGKGSTFKVWLPLAPSAGAEPAPQRPDPGAALNLFSLRVLVVDDNVDAAESLANLLRVHGHQTRVARDGIEAVEVTNEFHPDLILMDLVMPQLGGLEAAERIRQLSLPQQPEIMELTGETGQRDCAREAAIGISGQLLKPVSYTTLQELVRTTVERVNAYGAVRARFLVGSLELALSTLTSAELEDDCGKRERFVQMVRSSQERAVAQAARLSPDDPDRVRVEDLLCRLTAKLAAMGDSDRAAQRMDPG